MMNEKTDIPKLRFLGSSSDWETSKAASIFQINAGGDVPKDNVSQEKTGDFQYPIFANASENKGFYGYSDKYKITPPALTIAGRGVYIGIAHLRLEKFYPIVRLLVLKPKHKQKIDLGFFEYAFNNLNIFIESTGVPQLTAPQLSTYVISYPTLPEQQKIATFLIGVDRRIELLEQKKEKLEAYKKGVMQQLFSRQIRFKQDDGSVFPEWEERKLGEVAKITTGKLDANAMILDGEYRFYTCAREYYKIDKFTFDTEALLISGNGANIGYVHYFKGKFNAYQRTYVLTDLSENFLFIKYFLDQNLQKRIYREKKEGNTPYIVMGTLTEMELKIPNYREQEKIVTFLRSLNEITEKLTFQINQTQTWKKGLLQQMFI